MNQEMQNFLRIVLLYKERSVHCLLEYKTHSTTHKSVRLAYLVPGSCNTSIYEHFRERQTL